MRCVACLDICVAMRLQALCSQELEEAHSRVVDAEAEPIRVRVVRAITRVRVRVVRAIGLWVGYRPQP